MLKICNVQDFSLHDGPGVRTTIFLAGCPLKCVWCHNPETRNMTSTLIFEEKKCTSCKKCTVCPNDVHTFSPLHTVFREKCTLCGKCVTECNENALDFSTKDLSDEEFYELAERQKRLTGENGGITFSGGEPLMQGEKIIELAKSTDVNVALETCGYADENLFKRVIDSVDYVMFDLKLADENLHKKYTGVSNDLILRNLQILRNSGKDFVLRTPLIPNITDTKENLDAIKKIVGSDKWEKLEYNTLTPAKYARIGKEYLL